MDSRWPMRDRQASAPESQGPPPDRRTLASILDAVAAGEFPAADGGVAIVPQPSARDAGVIAHTGHAVIFADTDLDWIASQLPSGDLSAPLSARFLHALGERMGRPAHGIDMLACAVPLLGPPPLELATETDQGHPRIVRALRYRDNVQAWQAAGGIMLLGRGVAGRWEVAIEVDPADRRRGLGTALAISARHLVPRGAPLWAQIAPGNAASVRAFLAAGFRPVGAEALLSPAGPD
jgi:hypothetical protein